MNKTVLSTIVGTALLGLAKSKSGGRNSYKPRNIEDIYKLSAQEKSQITRLDLSIMGLTQIPDDIFDGFANLERIDLNNNQLTELPQSIGNLTNLKWLTLSSNQLTELPQSIGNLTNLEILLLGINKLTEPPNYIANLTNLKRLDLHRNPWQKPLDPKILFKMIQNRVSRNVIQEMILMNKSIKTKSNLRIR